MSKRRKKVVSNNTNKTAGDGRFSVLTDDKDTYNPFKGLSVDDIVIQKKKTSSSTSTNIKAKNNQNLVQKNKSKKIVETFDEDVSFADIFTSWENGRSLDNVKKKSKSKKSEKADVDFASVFSEWEKSQGIAPKVKKTPPKKSKEYKPKKDFGSLLNQFEGKEVKSKTKKNHNPNINQILKRTNDNVDEPKNKTTQKQQLNKSTKITEVPKNYKIIAASGNKKLQNNIKFENNNLNKGKNIKNKAILSDIEVDSSKLSVGLKTTNDNYKALDVKPVETKVVETKVVDVKVVDVKVVDVKVVDVKVVDVKVAEVKVADVKVADVKVADVKVADVKPVDVKPVDVKPVDVKPVDVKPVETKDALYSKKSKKGDRHNSKVDTISENSAKKSVSWNVDSNLSNKVNSNQIKTEIREDKELSHKKYSAKSNIKNSKNKSKEQKNKRAPFVVNTSPEDKVSSKWDFSDIYQAWSKRNEEEKAIDEAKKQKDKKYNKGISISYLRSMSPEAELDLHGLVSDIAFIRTREFLERSRATGLKKVSIITGKGLHSVGGVCVLRDTALSAISLSGIVREAYHPKACDGGSGVIWVIFKSTTDKKVYF